MIRQHVSNRSNHHRKTMLLYASEHHGPTQSQPLDALPPVGLFLMRGNDNYGQAMTQRLIQCPVASMATDQVAVRQ